jgi:hypothetical protein
VPPLWLHGVARSQISVDVLRDAEVPMIVDDVDVLAASS